MITTPVLASDSPATRERYAGNAAVVVIGCLALRAGSHVLISLSRTEMTPAASLNSAPKASLSWGLAIATYRRPTELLTCVTSALDQTLAPVEIVICDSTPEPDAAATREAIRALVEARGMSHIRLAFPPAPRPQQTSQRNAAVDASSADVLFMIDDDTYMHPKCAELVLATFEAGHDQGVVAVAADLSPTWPIADAALQHPSSDASPLQDFFWRLRSPYRWLRGPHRSVPRKLDLSKFPVPVKSVPSIVGACLVVRRDAVLKFRFEEDLLSNMHEDSDSSIKLLRLGALCRIRLPLMHHVAAGRKDGEARGSTLNRFCFSLNFVYLLYKWYGTGPYIRAYGVIWSAWLATLDTFASLLNGKRGAAQGARAAFREAVRLALTAGAAQQSCFLNAVEAARARWRGK
jgi:GT2 family glycosyltransferase